MVLRATINAGFPVRAQTLSKLTRHLWTNRPKAAWIALKPAPPTEPTTITAADATAPTGESTPAPRTAREKREALRKNMELQIRELSAKKGAA
jgi:hypothetical protein